MKKKLLFIGLISSSIAFSQNTLTKDDAGEKIANSGFYQTENPINYPSGATSWWHLLDVRHNNIANNYAMQFAGSFFDQNLYFRKTNDNASQPWSKVITQSNDGKVRIGLNDNDTASAAQLRVYGTEYALVDVANSFGRFQIARSGCNGCYGANTGDTVLRNNGGSHTIIISMPNDNNDGSSFIGIQDALHGNWVKFLNTAIAKIDGKVIAKEIEVKANVWADYVFANNYKLKSLEEVEKHIIEKGHLPNIPSTSEIIEKGINVAEMDAKLLEKIEELTLYSIEQNKKIEQQSKDIQDLKKQIDLILHQNTNK